MKRGPKRTGPSNPWRERYESDPAGFAAGVTIAEYEARHGLPLFTIWPEAEAARGPRDPGWFLYCTANEEERAELLHHDRSRIHRSTRSPGAMTHVKISLTRIPGQDVVGSHVNVWARAV